MHPTHPKSVKSGLIECPNIRLGLVDDNTGAIDFSGIFVFRNTNGDTIESCGYTAFLEHISTYAVVPIISSGGGGGSSGDNTPPSIRNQVYDKDEYPLIVNGLELKELNYSNKMDTQVIETGKEFNITLLINDNSGSSAIEFVGLFTNLNGHNRQVHQSDTYITYSSGEQLQFFDPNEFFSKVDMTKRDIGNKMELSFDITFDKEIPTSDIIIRMWDVKRNSQDTILSEVIKVEEANANPAGKIQSQNISKTQTPSIKSSDFKNMIEMWEGYQSDSVTDSEMINYLGITTNADSQNIIPKWFKANFSQWILDDLVTEKDMKEVLTWMNKKGMI